jgi:hypothetical protein
MRSMTTKLPAAGVLIAACALQNSTAVGQTPEQDKMWQAQRAQTQAEEKIQAEKLAKEREARHADPMAWVHTLDPMSSGGWVFKAVGADGSWATFSTDHQLKRSGHLVTLWLRQEYPEPHRSGAGDVYSSGSRVLLVIYYVENNLSGNQQTEEADPKQIEWDPIVPGTRSEYIFRWTCGDGSAGARPR